MSFRAMMLTLMCLALPIAEGYNGMTVLDPDYFDKIEERQDPGDRRAINPMYGCQAFTGSSHKAMQSSAFRKIKKTCKGDLTVQHIQPRKRFVPMNEWKKYETGYLLVCCKTAPDGSRGLRAE